MRTLVACALILAIPTLAPAATISSSSIYGGGTQSVAQCIVLNGGSSPVSVTIKILNESGGTVKSTNCGGPLAAGEFCPVAAIGISSGVSYACSATAGSVANLRGALTIEDNADHPIRSAGLH